MIASLLFCPSGAVAYESLANFVRGIGTTIGHIHELPEAKAIGQKVAFICKDPELARAIEAASSPKEVEAAVDVVSEKCANHIDNVEAVYSVASFLAIVVAPAALLYFLIRWFRRRGARK